MPSADPSARNRYPPSPTSMSGGPPHNADSPERNGHPPPPPAHGLPYSYVPSSYGPPPPSMSSYHHPMPQGGDKSAAPYGSGMRQYPPSTQYPGYGGGYMPAPYHHAAYGRPWMYEGGGPPPPPQGYGAYPSQHSMSGQPPPPIEKDQQRGRSSRGGHAVVYPLQQQQQQQHHHHQQQQPPQHLLHQQQPQHQQHRPHPILTMGKESDDAMTHPSTSATTTSVTSPGRRETSPDRPQSPHDAAEHLERIKAAQAAEQSLAEVRPIQTDFHFFVKDVKEKLIQAATDEVDASLKGKSEQLIKTHRTFLIYSNLNCRILKAWEDLARDEREKYFKKEEDDRQRFMEDDEVASRHCFTLTARIRSPNKKSPHEENSLNSPSRQEKTTATVEEDDVDDEEVAATSRMKVEDAVSGPEAYDDDKQGKRPSNHMLIPNEAADDSPSKKNKSGDDTNNEE